MALASRIQGRESREMDVNPPENFCYSKRKCRNAMEVISLM